jgi:hypothetical protein
MRSERVDALRASIYPLTATFTPQPPLTRPLEATTLPDLALEGPRCPQTTSVTEITGSESLESIEIPPMIAQKL